MVVGDTFREARPESIKDCSDQTEIWCAVCGLVPEKWRFEAFLEIKHSFPGVVCVVPVLAETAILMVRFRGRQREVPRAATILVEGVEVRILFDAFVPELVAGWLGLSRGEESYRIRGEKREAFVRFQKPCTNEEFVEAEHTSTQLCGRRGDHVGL